MSKQISADGSFSHIRKALIYWLRRRIASRLSVALGRLEKLALMDQPLWRLPLELHCAREHALLNKSFAYPHDPSSGFFDQRTDLAAFAASVEWHAELCAPGRQNLHFIPIAPNKQAFLSGFAQLDL